VGVFPLQYKGWKKSVSVGKFELPLEVVLSAVYFLQCMYQRGSKLMLDQRVLEQANYYLNQYMFRF